MTAFSGTFRYWEGVQNDPAIANAWGTPNSFNMTLVEAVQGGTGGSATVNIGGLSSYSLTTANGATDQARPFLQQYTGALTGDCTVSVPNVTRLMGWAQNLTTGGHNVILSAGGGTTLSIPNDGRWYWYAVDGATNVFQPIPVFGGALGPIFGTTGTFTGAITGASYSGGPISGTTGTFSGAVSASSYGAVSGTTGAFSGAVTGASYSGGAISGTTGTFSGAITGAGYSGGPVGGTTGTFSGAVSASALTVGGVTIPQIAHGHLGGLTLSNDGTSPLTVLDISAGTCTDSTSAFVINLGAFTKSTGGAWVAGSGNNGMAVGLATFTWYHVFAAIISGAADVFFDTSVTAANAPGGTTAFRRIGSFLTLAGSNIRAFLQRADEFLWATVTNDFSQTLAASTPLAATLTTPPGVRTTAILQGGATAGSTGRVLVQCPDVTQQAANNPAGNATVTWAAGAPGQFYAQVRTDAASTVNVVSSVASTVTNIVTVGYIDTRGRG